MDFRKKVVSRCWLTRNLLLGLIVAFSTFYSSSQPVAAQSSSCPALTDLRNEATVSADQGDPDLSDNTAAVCVTVPPNFALSKTLQTPDPVRVGDEVTFTLRITNTGSTPITTLPLRDLYDTASLLFLQASQLPDDSASDGQLDWSDLTSTFAQDLASNQSFALQVVFFARKDTTLQPGGATVNQAFSPLAPSQTVSATVRIEAPTAVGAIARSATYANGQVRLYWTTASEATVTAFRIWRRDLTTGGGWVSLQADLIPARFSGQASGAPYSQVDEQVQTGHTYLYVLEVLEATGASFRQELGVVVAGRLLFLPQVER